MAVPERNRHAEAHRTFTLTLPPADVSRWEAVARAWDEDVGYPKTADNPFEVEGKGKLPWLIS